MKASCAHVLVLKTFQTRTTLKLIQVITAEEIMPILSAGDSLVSHIAKCFASEGYNVIIVSQRGTLTESSCLAIKAKLAAPGSLKHILEQAKMGFAGVPSIVVFNGQSFISVRRMLLLISEELNLILTLFGIPMRHLEASPLALTKEELEDEHAVNITSAYVTAQVAVE